MSSKMLLSVFAVGMLIVAAFCVGVSKKGNDLAASPLVNPQRDGTPPYEQTNASADPSTIWVESSPPGQEPKESTLTLKLDGLGVPVKEYRPEDVMFVIDASWSMYENDPYDLRLEAAKHYVDLLNSSDRAAVVAFNYDAWLVGGDHLSSNFPHVKQNIDSITVDYYTNLYDSLRIATDELVVRGDDTHVWLEIFLTDGADTRGFTGDEILSQAQRAADNNITVFTIGLIGTGGVNESILMDIANVTNGEYLRAENATVLDDIYEEISQMVRYPDTAGRDNNVDAILPDYLRYVDDSAVPTPDFAGMYGGEFHLMWNFSKLKINETWTTTLNVTSSIQGAHLYALSYPDTMVTYTRYDDTRFSVPFPETFIDVIGNSAPNAEAGGPYQGYEGTAVTLDASGSSDPDNDSLMYRWDFENDGIWDTPWMTDATLAHVWGDDFVGNVALEVSDGNFTDTDTANVTILNVPPTILDMRAVSIANLTLRVAGEKWHDVTLTLFKDGNETASVGVTRYPGSPDEQTATIENVTIDLTGAMSAVVMYTPMDDPINGQIWGSTPAWLILTAKDGSEVRIHHEFNVRHNDTWVWNVTDLRVFLVGLPIEFSATAHDVGSDDLYFVWDSGDGRNLTKVTFNNGVSPDAYPSPDVNPITAMSYVEFTYPVAGTYVMTLTVEDDDGGSTEISMTITIG